jgi:hypothetical protein
MKEEEVRLTIYANCSRCLYMATELSNTLDVNVLQILYVLI